MLINGTRQQTLDAQSRGLAYGDGVFETILVHGYQPVLLEQHLQRLEKGCLRLGLKFDSLVLCQEIDTLSVDFPERGVLKIILSRCAGGRGYWPDPDAGTDRILSLHAAPDRATYHRREGIHAFVCSQRMALQPALAGIKHLNRLEQVLASRDWPGYGNMQEGLMLDTAGNIVEGTRSNVFWADGEGVYTPDLKTCGIEGVLRGELLKSLPGTPVQQVARPLTCLGNATEMFFCNSVIGVLPVLCLQADQGEYRFTPGQICEKARLHFERILKANEN